LGEQPDSLIESKRTHARAQSRKAEKKGQGKQQEVTEGTEEDKDLPHSLFPLLPPVIFFFAPWREA
jgi:hypothetical protein